MYTKGESITLKIVRCKHGIEFDSDTTVEKLKEDLSNVPLGSTVDESYLQENGKYILIFHEEQQEIVKETK